LSSPLRFEVLAVNSVGKAGTQDDRRPTCWIYISRSNFTEDCIACG